MWKHAAIVTLVTLVACAPNKFASQSFPSSTNGPPPIATPTADNPVTMVAWVSSDPAMAGDDVQLHVRLSLAAGYHIQPADAQPPLVRTSIQLEPQDGFIDVSPWLCSTPGQRVPLTDTVTWTKQLRATGALVAGKYAFQCLLTYQACDSDLCWPVRTVTLMPSFTVVR